MRHDQQTLTIRSDICRKIVNTVSAPAAIGPYNQVLQGIFSGLICQHRQLLKIFHSVFFLFKSLHVTMILKCEKASRPK